MQQFLGLHRELHRQTGEDLAGIPIDNQAHGLFRADAALVAVEELVLADLRGCRLVLDDGRRVVGADDREGMGPALGADQEAVALGIVAGVLRPGIPLETIRLLVFRPMWTIFVPVSACWKLFVTATE